MRVVRANLLAGAAEARGLTVIVDVFRAFTTACHVASASPSAYLLVGDSATAARLASEKFHPLLVGKPELGTDLVYQVPNSPTRIAAHRLYDRTVIHRSGAGARGLLRATAADEVIVAGFVNVEAVVRYVKRRDPPEVTLVAMGHEGATRSLEDELCVEAIAARLSGETFDLEPWLAPLRDGPGRYFFSEMQEEYPRDDFDRCTEIDRFSLVLQAELRGDYAELRRIDD